MSTENKNDNEKTFKVKLSGSGPEMTVRGVDIGLTPHGLGIYAEGRPGPSAPKTSRVLVFVAPYDQLRYVRVEESSTLGRVAVGGAGSA